MDKRNAFENFNPIVNIIFFLFAIIFGMIFMHPLYLIISSVLSVVFYISVAGDKAFKLFITMLPIVLLVALLNPLLNDRGDTVLFVYFNRNYTLEGLIYGIVFALIVLVVSFWFASYSKLITSDKFIYIFGPLAPALSLVFTMVLRFVPNYLKKARQIITARKSIGKGGKKDAPAVLGALTTWAFESGITTSESMKSRGYGSGKRTNYSIYKFRASDLLVLVLMTLLSIIVAFCSIKGGTSASFVPTLIFETNTYTFVGAAAYALLLLIPSLINLKEVIMWQILKSKI